MSTQHTPGPWKVGVHATGPSGQGRTEIITHDGFWLADVLNSKEYQANARLIAAAPDLLAALKHTQSILHGDVCQQYADCVEACEIAQAAIAKAEEGS